MASTDEPKESLAVGGQAVMEGVMMRNGANLALAVRTTDGSIVATKKPWISLFSGAIVKRKWLRGFPILVETMANGVTALNLSAELSESAEAEKIKPWQLAFTLITALGLAFLLFVITPHFLTVLLGKISLSGGVEGISFHIWDGIIKFLLFLGYIAAIGRLPEIRRVFEYHGAEHKTISTYEHEEDLVSVENAKKYSRLHPRCGTTFLLFVLVISIVLHTTLVPAALWLWTPESVILKHTFVLIVKFFLIIPIGSIAYETIRWASRNDSGVFGKIVRAPGLLLQYLTTREPDSLQLGVAIVALEVALGKEAETKIDSPEYRYLEQV